MEKVPVYIYFRIEGAAVDEEGNVSPAYASLLLGHVPKGKEPPYKELISRVTVHDILSILPVLNVMYKEEQISFCTPEEYSENADEEQK